MPASTNGTSRNEITGLANRFTTKPAKDTLPNHASVKGASAIPTRHWVTSKARTALGVTPPFSRSPASNTAIAPNDSQKPDDSGAKGSRASTANSAQPSTSNPDRSRPLSRISHQTASITTVRWVGMPKPASNA